MGCLESYFCSEVWPWQSDSSVPWKGIWRDNCQLRESQASKQGRSREFLLPPGPAPSVCPGALLSPPVHSETRRTDHTHGTPWLRKDVAAGGKAVGCREGAADRPEEGVVLLRWRVMLPNQTSRGSDSGFEDAAVTRGKVCPPTDATRNRGALCPRGRRSQASSHTPVFPAMFGHREQFLDTLLSS